MIILTTQKLIHTVYQSLVLPLILLYDGNGSILNQLHVSDVYITKYKLIDLVTDGQSCKYFSTNVRY